MTALFAAETAAVGCHILINILIAHGGLGIIDTALVKGFVKAEIGHDRGNHGVHQQLAPFLHILTVDIKDMVTGDNIALFVHTQAAVGIAVVSKANIQAILHNVLLQHLNVGGACIAVDVVAIGFRIDHVGLRTHGIKHGLCDIPGGTVGAVQANLDALERIHSQRNQISDVPVTACHIVHSPSDLISLCHGQFFPLFAEGFQFSVQIGFHQFNGGLIHLFAKAVDQLDAVIIIRIVGGGDHNTAVKILGTAHIGNGGCGGNMEQISIRAGGNQSTHQAVLKHIAGTPGILTDNNLGRRIRTAAALQLGIVPAQKTTDLKRVISS